MDRRSLLKMFGVAAAAAAVMAPAVADAMPAAPRSGAVPTPAGVGPSVATDADIEAAKPEKAYYGWRRRYYRPRFYRRRYFYRPRRFYRRRFWY